MIIVIATHNKAKVREFTRVLEPLGYELKTADEMGFHEEVEETGSTFAENAFIKANAVCRALSMPAVADDSGLSVDALGGKPGIYSARYGGGSLTDSEKIDLILSELKDVPDENRGAHFTSAICCLFPDGRKVECEGKVYGKIAHEKHGTSGFGYDPIFCFENGNKTFGEATAEEKDAVSHRGKSLREFSKLMKKLGE